MVLRKFTLLSIIIVFGFNANAQKKANYLLPYIDSSLSEPKLGFKNINGSIAIKAKYSLITFDEAHPKKMYKMALVYSSEHGFIYINRNDSIVLKPYIYDNGPDYIEEGLFRFIENDSIGFANTFFKKIIKAKYNFATPFKNGIAEYYIGGEKIYNQGMTTLEVVQKYGTLEDMHWT
jgi:hypothetical protein